MDNSTLKVSHNDREKHSALTGKKGELIDHREISKEERFHSFIFCRTVLPALA